MTSHGAGAAHPLAAPDASHAVTGGMARTVAWFALALTGEIARLQLMRAGPLVGYQHYLRPGELFAQAPIATAIVSIQGAIVVAGLWRLWPVLRARVGTAYRRWQLLAIAVVFFAFSATLSRNPIDFGAELVLATLLQAIALGTILCTAASVPIEVLDAARARLHTLFGGEPDDHPVRIDRFVVVAAAWVVLVCAILAVFSYQRHPHVPDEVSYIYQARYFARGMLDMPPPPVFGAFNLDLMTYEPTRWYSPVPPGWPAVLSLGVAAGVPWLVNPVLNGLNVVLAYLLIGDIYGRRTARWTALLLASSPWFLFMGMNFMTHTATLFFTLVAGVAVARMRRSGRLAWGALGGAALGMVSIIRPLEGLAVAGVLGLWSLTGRSTYRYAIPQFVVLALSSMVAGATVLPYNKAVAGSATTFPLMAYTDAMYGRDVNALGFGANRGIGWPGLDPLPGHGFIDIFINADLNTYQVNVELLGWSVGSLLIIALLAFSGRMRREDWAMLGAIGVIVGLHSFYWFSGGPDFGARYWYLIIIPCIVLAARGIETVADAASTGNGKRETGNDMAEGEPRIPIAEFRHHQARVVVGALALCVITLCVFVPWRAVDKYYHYRRMEPGVERLAEEHGFGSSLVLVRGRRHPDYASAATYNPLDLRADAPIYVWDRNQEVREEVLGAYPDRSVWIVAGPTETGRGFQLLAGPLTSDEARAWQPDEIRNGSGRTR